MKVSESFEILEINRDSGVQEIRFAWRQKAASLHPDVGGTHEAMIRLNEAFDTAMAFALANHVDAEAPTTNEPLVKTRGFVARDLSSFTIAALPVDAWHLLYPSASQCGPIIEEQEPYLLEFMLSDCAIPSLVAAMCRCEVVPEAGGSTVHLSLFSEHGRIHGVETVRDLLVSSINEIADFNHS
jgi:hypothetical protein